VGLGAQAISFLLGVGALHPHYLSTDVDVATNATSRLSTDAAQIYGRFAQALLDRGTFSTDEGPVVSHMPGTSLLLALSKKLSGHLGSYGALQAALFIASVYFFSHSGASRWGQGPALLAATVFLLHPQTLYTGWTVNSDAWFTTGFLCFLALFLTTAGRTSGVVLSGLCLGLACYFREAGMAIMVGAVAVCLWNWRRDWRIAAGLMLGVLVPLTPWMLRSATVTGFPSPGTSKTAYLFFLSSLELGLRELNPFDIDEGGRINYDRLHAYKEEYLAAHPPPSGSRPTTAYFLKHGMSNYLTHPSRQAKSLALRLVNLMRPPVARRHLNLVLSRDLSTVAYGILFLVHAALVWGGLWFCFRGPSKLPPALQGSLIVTVAAALCLWCEPRYLYPFYPLLFVVAIDAGGRIVLRKDRRAASQPAPQPHDL
jgi:hypothetical protein